MLLCLAAPAYIDPASALLMISAKELSNNYLYKHILCRRSLWRNVLFWFIAGTVFLSFLRDPHLWKHCSIQNAQAFYSQKWNFFRGNGKGQSSVHWLLDKPSDPAGRGHTALMRSFFRKLMTICAKNSETIFFRYSARNWKILWLIIFPGGKISVGGCVFRSERLNEPINGWKKNLFCR